MVGIDRGGREARDEQQLDRLEDPGVRGLGGCALARVCEGGHGPRETSTEPGDHVCVEGDVAACALGRGEIGIVAVRVVPRADVDARARIEVQLTPDGVERQARLDPDLGARQVGFDTEAPDHAFPVEPRVVQAHLPVREGLLGLEVVDSEQHAEVVVDRRERACS